MFTAHNPRRLRAWLPLLLALLIFCSLAAYQLDLPGLHYDEAKEAGLNAMQLVRGQPVTLFRNAGLHLFGLTLPRRGKKITRGNNRKMNRW